MARYTTNELKKEKEKTDKAKEEISKLFHLQHNGKLTWDEYCLQRIPYLEILGTLSMYDEFGKLKS